MRLLRLAYENGKLRLPVIRELKEAAPRQGLFERESFEAVRRHLPEDLRVAVTIAHTFGWRMQSEVLTLELRQVALVAGTIRLDPGATKNDEGRIVYLTPELQSMLRAQVERAMALMRKRGAAIPYLFPHLIRALRWPVRSGLSEDLGHRLQARRLRGNRRGEGQEDHPAAVHSA